MSKTDEELLVQFKQYMQEFKAYYIEKMQECQTVEELDKLKKEWSSALNACNHELWKNK